MTQFAVQEIVESVLNNDVDKLARHLTLARRILPTKSAHLELNSSETTRESLAWTTSRLVCGLACALRWYDDAPDDLDGDSEEEEDGDPWNVVLRPSPTWKRSLVESQHFLGKVTGGGSCVHDAGFNVLQLSMCLDTDAVALRWLEFVKDVGMGGTAQQRQWCLDHLRASFGTNDSSAKSLPPLPLRARVDNANSSLHLASFLGHSNIVRYLLYLEDELSQQSGQQSISRTWRNRKNSQGYKALDCCVDEYTKRWFFLVNERISRRASLFTSTYIDSSQALQPQQTLPAQQPRIQEQQTQIETTRKKVRFERDALFLDACKQSGECKCQSSCPIVLELIKLLDWPRTCPTRYELLDTNNEASTLDSTAPTFSDTLPVTSQTELTPLHVASTANHLPLVKFLLEHGHPVNVRDVEGWTPLHCASAEGNSETVALLVQFDAVDSPVNLLAKNGEGETAWDVSPLAVVEDEPRANNKGEGMKKSTTKPVVSKEDMVKRGKLIRELLDRALDVATAKGVEFPADELTEDDLDEDIIRQTSQISMVSIESTASSIGSLDVSPVVLIDKASSGSYVSSPNRNSIMLPSRRSLD